MRGDVWHCPDCGEPLDPDAYGAGGWCRPCGDRLWPWAMLTEPIQEPVQQQGEA